MDNETTTRKTDDRGYAGPKMHTESEAEYADRVDLANKVHNERPSVWIRGEGGHVWEMDLPLPEGIQDRLAQGKLSRVNEDGTDWTGVTKGAKVTAGATVTSAKDEIPGIDEDEDPDPELGKPLVRPADNASLTEWRNYATAPVERGGKGADAKSASNLTKPELIKQYG